MAKSKKIKRVYICDTCHGNGYIRIATGDTSEDFNSQYDCLMFGYKESIVKMEELGRTDVNKYGMFIKFYCTPDNTI